MACLWSDMRFPCQQPRGLRLGPVHTSVAYSAGPFAPQPLGAPASFDRLDDAATSSSTASAALKRSLEAFKAALDRAVFRRADTATAPKDTATRARSAARR